ncbi:hypothetical protein BOTBODRAFT_499738 [Botryobasidium botryosum FD-172 SS1]|uniref:Uncharacterized protein n=1 Tax=Botryobasidium botryosum (strain FD-172 SS1) TaxID=930990 RepID=A0A067M3R4_BOTB1|nr:hypothetical protein BOTBODRAFT_499738 [Botryobasidium botryosum FD-172 SS1]
MVALVYFVFDNPVRTVIVNSVITCVVVVIQIVSTAAGAGAHVAGAGSTAEDLRRREIQSSSRWPPRTVAPR